jgi:hypothetical protein
MSLPRLQDDDVDGEHHRREDEAIADQGRHVEKLEVI